MVKRETQQNICAALHAMQSCRARTYVTGFWIVHRVTPASERAKAALATTVLLRPSLAGPATNTVFEVTEATVVPFELKREN